MKLLQANALALAVILALVAAPAWADIGQIKTRKGQVSVERAGQVLPAEVGMQLEAADTVKTGADGVRTVIACGDCLAMRPETTASVPR